MTTSLLPPNATQLERALEQGVRVHDLTTPADVINDPLACPAEILPWLAWELSVDTWDATWSEATKRQAVAESIELHRRKGTRWAVENVLARIDALAEVVEWHEAQPALDVHTFEIRVPIDATSGARALAAVPETIVRDVVRVKPLREHLVVVQSLSGDSGVGVHAVARTLLARRDDAALTDDQSQPWDTLLQTEEGEPMQAETGTLLDTNA